MHCVITTSTSSSSMFQAGLFSRVLLTVPVMLPWFSQSLVCLASQNSLFKPGYKQLFQTEAVTDDFSFFFPPSLPENQKQQHKKGMGRKGRRRPHLPHSQPATATESSLPPPCSLHSSLRLLRLELRWTEHSSSTDQGKTLTFSDIQCSPYSPASRFVLHLIQYAQFQLFSLKYQTLQRQKKIPFSPAAVTQQAETIHSLWTRRQLQFSSQIQCSTCYFLCFNQFRMWKAAGGRAGKGEERRPAGLSGLARTALASCAAAHSCAQHRLQLECGMDRIPYFVCTHSPSQFTAFLRVSSKNPHATSCQCSYLDFHSVLILFSPSP